MKQAASTDYESLEVDWTTVRDFMNSYDARSAPKAHAAIYRIRAALSKRDTQLVSEQMAHTATKAERDALLVRVGELEREISTRTLKNSVPREES
jgi:hypothetical protein